MKKKLIVALVMLTTSLCSCSNGKTKGIVDCSEIKVTNGESVVFSGEYSITLTNVFEYQSNDGKSIYTDCKILDYDGNACDIYAYPNRFTSDYTIYKFEGLVGSLVCEQNYYLDLDARIVDHEMKWSKCETKAEWPEDNEKAYNCARKNYYLVSPLTTTFNPETNVYYYPIRMDLCEKSLDRHIYTKFGDNNNISYIAKCF